MQKPHSLEKVNAIIVNCKNLEGMLNVYLVLWESHNVWPCSVGWRADQFEYPLELFVDITAREEGSATVSHLYIPAERERDVTNNYGCTVEVNGITASV